MKNPFITVGLSVFGGTVVVISFIVFKAVTGDFSCSRPYVNDGYQATMKCSYNGVTFNIPLAGNTAPR